MGVHETHERHEKGEILVYRSPDGQVKLDVRLQDETVWLTQQAIADLFLTTVPNISMHIRNVYEEGELTMAATVKKFLTVRSEGNSKQDALGCSWSYRSGTYLSAC